MASGPNSPTRIRDQDHRQRPQSLHPRTQASPEHLSHGCGSMRDNAKGVNGNLLKDEAAKEKGDFFASWGGISSVGLGLPILWTEATSPSRASSQNPIGILEIVKLCAMNTAKQVGLQYRKGALRPGMDADICVFDDALEWVVGGRNYFLEIKLVRIRER
ncbi:hypothetical protein DID88_002489 [Monilinia fructigena]|uniref:Uncharacterized protein n=1 Tax=Monilinia fructigena TaxID=38457 RepID=A0A395INY4_9HELO|nr:hypothetical protein DID88_002489 [Monilinia fructigena]